MGEGVSEQARALAADGGALAGAWLSSPTAWSQLALLVAAWLLAVLANRALRPRIAGFLTPPETAETAEGPRLDDGPNPCTSDVRFLIRNACKDNGIEMPFPHRVVALRGAAAA